MSDDSSIQRFSVLAKDFASRSHEVLPSQLSAYQVFITLLLAVLSFTFVALALLNRKSSTARYFLSATVASFSIGLGTVYACNFFGVYI